MDKGGPILGLTFPGTTTVENPSTAPPHAPEKPVVEQAAGSEATHATGWGPWIETPGQQKDQETTAGEKAAAKFQPITKRGLWRHIWVEVAGQHSPMQQLGWHTWFQEYRHMASVEIPILRDPAVDKREVLRLAEFLRPLRRALVKGDTFNPGKLAPKLFHGWMPSQTFVDIAANALGPHSLEELGRAISIAQLPPSRDLEDDPRCPNTLLPVVQCIRIQEDTAAYFFVRLHPWLRIGTATSKQDAGNGIA